MTTVGGGEKGQQGSLSEMTTKTNSNVKDTRV